MERKCLDPNAAHFYGEKMMYSTHTHLVNASDFNVFFFKKTLKFPVVTGGEGLFSWKWNVPSSRQRTLEITGVFIIVRRLTGGNHLGREADPSPFHSKNSKRLSVFMTRDTFPGSS